MIGDGGGAGRGRDDRDDRDEPDEGRPRHMAGKSGRSRRAATDSGRRGSRPLPVPPDPMTPGPAGPPPRTGRSRRAAAERTTGEWTIPIPSSPPPPVGPPAPPAPERSSSGSWRAPVAGPHARSDPPAAADRGAYGPWLASTTHPGSEVDDRQRGSSGSWRARTTKPAADVDDRRAAHPRRAPGDGDGDGDGGSGGDGGGRSAGWVQNLPPWLLPAVLGVAAVVAAIGAIVLNGDDAAEAVGITDPATPVLSPRRVPELIAAPVADRRLTADLESWVAQSTPSSCLVVNAGSRPLYRHNPDMPLVGASTQKVVTATALLLAHGPDARLNTVAGTTAPPAAGVVAGDLYLVGGGDPTIATPGYVASLSHGQTVANDPAKLADAIKAAGIRRIEGGVVGDDSRYDNARYHPSWPSRFHGTEVGGVSALSIDDSKNTLGLDPPAADPPTYAAAVLTRLLTDRGVQVGKPARAGAAPADMHQVAELPSPTMREIVAEMLTGSDDDTAEMSFKEVGVEKAGAGTWAAGATAVNTLLADAGVPLDGTRIVEGSGLSSDDRINCSLLVDLLTRPETGPVIVDGLAVAGETGTLADRFESTQAKGRLRAKTGTLNQVTALTGQVDTLQGGALTFSYITNKPDGDTIDQADVDRQEGLADILVRYPRGVDLNALLPAAAPAPADAAAAPSDGAPASSTTVPPAQ